MSNQSKEKKPPQINNNADRTEMASPVADNIHRAQSV
jgi:hypothetical protein